MQAMKQMFDEVFFLQAPTMLNIEVARNFRPGLKFCCCTPEWDKFEMGLKLAVQGTCNERPVIVIAEDEDAATRYYYLLKPVCEDKLMLFTELNSVGSKTIEGIQYQKIKKKLENLKHKARVVVIVTKEASRGVDFQFRQGTPAAHVIISFVVDKRSDLLQAIGRSCRQKGHDQPSWEYFLCHKNYKIDSDVLLALIEGEESTLSMLASSLFY